MERKISFLLLWLMMIGGNNMFGQREEGKRNISNFQYEDCGCDFKVNLRIFHGQNGQEVDEEFEDSKGALTVANRNGDNGGSEIDLMKLIIEPKGKKASNCEVIIDSQGNIAFWENSDKTGSITNLNFNSNDLPKTIWIEALDVSNSVTDIVIESRIGNNTYDMVKATALWCDFVSKYIEGNTPAPSVTDAPLSGFIPGYIDANGGYYGLGYFNNSDGIPSFGGRILVEFELKPPGVKDLWPIHFDVTRRISKK